MGVFTYELSSCILLRFAVCMESPIAHESETMQEHQPSRTAQYAASFRALEDVRRPARVRLFADPFAVQFLAVRYRRIVRVASWPLLGPAVRRLVEWRYPGAMTSGIARTRLIDDFLHEALRDGIKQIVILGAGFDCRAWRMPELADRRIIEVDHPATQALKRERLEKIGAAIPPSLTFAAIDFTRQRLDEVLAATSFDPHQRSFVLWEGVTHYLGERAVDQTLRTIAAVTEPGSRLVFTYLHRGLIDGTMTFAGARSSQRQVAGHREPWIWGMMAAELPDYLAERGFTLLEDLGADDYRARYWGERGRRMRGFSFYRVALAEMGVDEMTA